MTDRDPNEETVYDAKGDLQEAVERLLRHMDVEEIIDEVKEISCSSTTSTLHWVKEMLQRIEGSVGDPEGAHSLEDALHKQVLSDIAHGTCEDPQACAAEAMKSADIDFPRWCA